MTSLRAPQKRLLRKLAACEPGQGLVLDKFDRGVARGLFQREWVEWMQDGRIRVYRLTQEGREAAAALDIEPAQPEPEPENLADLDDPPFGRLCGRLEGAE